MPKNGHTPNKPKVFLPGCFTGRIFSGKTSFTFLAKTGAGPYLFLDGILYVHSPGHLILKSGTTLYVEFTDAAEWLDGKKHLGNDAVSCSSELRGFWYIHGDGAD